MDNSLLMGVLDRLAYWLKQLESLANGELLVVAILRDWHARDQFHHEIRPARVRSSRIEHLGDIRMVHHCQGLPLRFEACDHLPRVHARLDDLERDGPLERLGLFRHEDDAHSAFTNLM